MQHNNTIRSLVVASSTEAWAGRERGAHLTPAPNLAGDPREVMGWAADVLSGDGALVLPGAGRVLGVEAWVADLREAGWRGTDAATMTEYGWGTYRAGRANLSVGLARWWDTDRLTPVDPTEWPISMGELAARLALYHELTGEPWRGTAGLSGHANLRRRLRRHPELGGPVEPMWRWDDAPDDLFYGVTDTSWMREPTAAERSMRWVHLFDVRAMHLAAAASAALCWSVPEVPAYVGVRPQPGMYRVAVAYVGVRPQPGMYRVAITPALAGEPGGPPVVAAARIDDGGAAWVTHRTLTYWHDRGEPVKVLDARVPADPNGDGQFLRPWAHRLRDALLSPRVPDGGPMELAVKQTYRETIGLFGRPGGRIYRPDWRATLIETARCNLYDKLGRAFALGWGWPMEVTTDAVAYASDSDTVPAELATALGLPRGGIGALRLTGTVPMADYLDIGRSGAHGDSEAVSGGVS